MSRRPRVPAKVRRAALERAQAMVDQRRSVYGHGLGFKWRQAHGYGSRPVLALKFLVRRKSSRGRPLPRSITVTVAGRRWRFLTDVEAIPTTAVEHANATCSLMYERGSTWKLGSTGACGFFVQSPESGKCFLITAGHVFLRPGRKHVSADQALIAGAVAGSVLPDLSYRNFGDPRVDGYDPGFVDIGIAEVTETEQHAEIPQRLLNGTTTRDDLVRAWQEERQPEFRVYAPGEEYACKLDTAWQTAIPLKVNGRPARHYASVVFTSTAVGIGEFRAGHSGSPILWGDRLVGIHFLGRGARSRKGHAIAAETLMDVARSQLGENLHLVGSMGLR